MGRNAPRDRQDLYERLGDYLKDHLLELKSAAEQQTDEGLLTLYTRQWNRYLKAAQLIHKFFEALNRHFVKKEIDEGKIGMFNVYTLHLVRWKQDFFLQVKDRIRNVLVEKQRSREANDTAKIKEVEGSFSFMDFDEQGAHQLTTQPHF
jgi:cullin 1